MEHNSIAFEEHPMNWAFILFLALAALLVFFAPLYAEAVYALKKLDEEQRRRRRRKRDSKVT